MGYQGIRRGKGGVPLAPCTACGYSGKGHKTTHCGWCDEEDPAHTTSFCTGCGDAVHPLEVFPKNRCIACHADAPEVKRDAATMTAEKLTRMWGGKA